MLLNNARQLISLLWKTCDQNHWCDRSFVEIVEKTCLNLGFESYEICLFQMFEPHLLRFMIFRGQTLRHPTCCFLFGGGGSEPVLLYHP